MRAGRKTEPRGGAPARPLMDRALRALGRLVFSTFFREVRVLGAENFPESGPVVVAANHFNSIADGALIATYLPRMPRMLAASTVWNFRAVAPLLDAAGVIPIYRQAETRGAARQNQDSFARVFDLLASGGVLGLFPEGISHNEPGVKPLKSGTARLILEAEKQKGPLDVTVLPVGLFFEAKSKFRSRLLICIGTPVDITQEAAAYRSGDSRTRAACVRAVSDRLHAALMVTAPSFDSWQDARLLGRTADMWAQPEMDLPAKVPLVESFRRRVAFLEGYRWLRRHEPDRIAAFRESMVRYDRLLKEAGLRDEEVAATYPSGAVTHAVIRSALSLTILAPLGLIGTVLNYVPWKITAYLGRGNDPDKRASWAIFASLIVLPLYWLLQAGAAGLAWWALTGSSGWTAAAVTLIAAPATGAFALPFHDLLRQAMHRARAWWLLRRDRAGAERLQSERQAVLKELAGLVEFYDTRPQT